MAQKKASRKQWHLDRAREGNERSIRYCVKQGWMEDPAEQVDDWRNDPESIAERRMEAFHGARMAGCSMESAMEAYNDVLYG